MIHVGGRGGTLALVPTSSSIITRTYSQLADEADGWPSLNRSKMKEPVLAYQAPSPFRLDGRNAGQVYFGDPSACSTCAPSRMTGFCLTTSSVSRCGARLSRNSMNSIFPSSFPVTRHHFGLDIERDAARPIRWHTHRPLHSGDASLGVGRLDHDFIMHMQHHVLPVRL